MWRRGHLRTFGTGHHLPKTGSDSTHVIVSFDPSSESRIKLLNETNAVPELLRVNLP